MPKGFTEQEKAKIRKRLMETGKEEFGRSGIKKTSVEDLARKAGISKGAFYQFFSSKEELYFAVMKRLETEMHELLYGLIARDGGDERLQFKNAFREILKRVEEDPFFRKLLAREEFDYLWQKFTPDQMEESMKTDVDFSAQLVSLWKQRGRLKVEDPRVVAGAFRALFFILLHREEVGTDVFDQVMDLLLEAAVDKILD